MNTIFHVLSNLKHDGVVYETGSFLEGELAVFEYLAKDGILRIMKGAANVEEAAKIIADELKVKAMEAELQTKIVAKPLDNTWGPKPDEPKRPEPAAPETSQTAGQPEPAKVETGTPDNNSITSSSDEAESETGDDL